MAKVLPKPRLPNDATIATVVDGLAEPEEYVRRVFASMGKRSRLMQVRIGVRSDPEAPDYMLDECTGEPADPTDPNDQGQPVPMEAYNGRTHRELAFAKADDRDNWSNERMTWAQVQALLGRLRGL
jgi:hypothetical protein